MKIGLLSCTSSKKSYSCTAAEMYSESPRFRLAYEYAKLTCDKIFVLSAKYGLLLEEEIIEPYNETLNDKSTYERREWSNQVISRLKIYCNVDLDEFIILAGVNYNQFLIPHLKTYELPLKGVTLFKWIPKLNDMIAGLSNKEMDRPCERIHQIFNKMPRMRWKDIDNIPFHNGVYIMFEEGEKCFGKDRIVRIGTHTSDNRLHKRLKDHYLRMNKDGSIFRKNIGLALLRKDNDEYEEIWKLNTSSPKIKEMYSKELNLEYQKRIEEKVSKYLKDNISFVCMEVDFTDERIRIEEGIISLLNESENFKSNSKWLGNYHPRIEIQNSGLWNVKGLNSKPLSLGEVEELQNNIDGKAINKTLVFGGRGSLGEQRNVNKLVYNNEKDIKKDNSKIKKTTTAEIADFIKNILNEKKIEGLEYVDIVSGDIHKMMNLKSRMSMVCSAMYKLKGEKDIIKSTTPSGQSSTIKIRYFL